MTTRRTPFRIKKSNITLNSYKCERGGEYFIGKLGRISVCIHRIKIQLDCHQIDGAYMLI